MTIIGKRYNHQQMKDLVGSHLYQIKDNKIEKVYIVGIKINDANKWEFTTIGENEILFYSIKSAKRWAKKHHIDLLPIY